jgi:hypothetical protein
MATSICSCRGQGDCLQEEEGVLWFEIEGGKAEDIFMQTERHGGGPVAFSRKFSSRGEFANPRMTHALPNTRIHTVVHASDLHPPLASP